MMTPALTAALLADIRGDLSLAARMTAAGSYAAAAAMIKAAEHKAESLVRFADYNLADGLIEGARMMLQALAA